MIDRISHVWAYARASDARKQLLSVERQEADTTARAMEVVKETGGVFGGCRTDKMSASRFRYHERPGFSSLMREMQEGDHLVVWRLDRLDRGALLALTAVLRWLFEERKIHLHVLDHGTMKIDMTSSQGKAWLGMMAVFAAWESDRISESTKTGMAFCRRNGLWLGMAHFGRCKGPKRNGKHSIVWDLGECDQIREIWRRYNEGEAIWSIAMDFLRRDERTATGRPWVSKNRSTKVKSRGSPCVSRVYNAIKWYRDLLDRGLDLGYDMSERDSEGYPTRRENR